MENERAQKSTRGLRGGEGNCQDKRGKWWNEKREEGQEIGKRWQEMACRRLGEEGRNVTRGGNVRKGECCKER
jgi:hypothetical protein